MEGHASLGLLRAPQHCPRGCLVLELRYPSAAALLPLPVEQDPGRQPGAPSPAVPCACSRRANACWLFFSVKQISLAHYFCKIFKKEQPPTAESQPKCESQQILGRVKGALPARRPPASQIRLQGRNLPAVDVLWRHPWRHRSAPLPASADFSVPGRCAQDSGIPKQRGGGSHNSSPAGSSPDPSLRLVCRVYAELCKLILEIPRASVRWFL